METEKRNRIEQKAIELTRHVLEEVSPPTPQISDLADGHPGATADGHIQNPPVYPAFKSDTFTIRPDNERPGSFWVFCMYKITEGSQWIDRGTLFSYSEFQ